VSAADRAEDCVEAAEQVARAASAVGLGVGTAESLTSGRVATELGRATDATQWFRGSVVAYASEVKFQALGVPEGPVITREAALQMAEGAARLLGADVVVSLTGAGGPGSEEGQDAGTVWFGCVWPGGRHAVREVFDGDPAEVVVASTLRALRLLGTTLEDAAADRTG
jgi:nicotinamide-nucleotide amidase